MALHTTSLSSSSSNHLFSTIITLYTLIFLYFPNNFHSILFSPTILSSSLLILSLLRLGATQKIKHENIEKYFRTSLSQIPHSCKWVSRESHVGPNTEHDPDFHPSPNPEFDPSPNPDHKCKWVLRESDVGPNTGKDPDFDPYPDHDCNRVSRKSHVGPTTKVDPDTDPDFEFDPVPDYEFEPNPDPFNGESFVEWNMGASLEVIHEYHEDEEEMGVIERYASLSMYYLETDTDSSSVLDLPVIGNWDSPENMGFRWEEEDKEGLIEIELDGKRSIECEEEDLIEIDLTPASFPAR